MEVQVRSRNRRVPHPRLHRDRIDSASQPQTRRRMPKIMDPPPLTDRRPIQGRLERRCVQLMGESRSRTGERPGRDQPSSAAPSTGLLPISEDTTVSTRRSPPEKPTECSQREQAAREQRRRINRVRTIDGHAYLLVSTWERSHRPEADAWRPPSKSRAVRTLKAAFGSNTSRPARTVAAALDLAVGTPLITRSGVHDRR